MKPTVLEGRLLKYPSDLASSGRPSKGPRSVRTHDATICFRFSLVHILDLNNEQTAFKGNWPNLEYHTPMKEAAGVYMFFLNSFVFQRVVAMHCYHQF